MVTGAGMEPNYHNSDYVLINKLNKDYKRGDIIIFNYPRNPQEIFIQRIIALPGEKIQLKDGFVFLYDEKNNDGYKLSEPYLKPSIQTTGSDDTIQLKDNQYYVLGDNRENSMDSRVFGPLEDSYIIGKIWTKIY